MHTWVYVSAAQALFDDQQLSALLTQSRRDNRARGITGMLLYVDGNFMQALEGEHAIVEALLQKISRDPRHKRIVTLYHAPIPERNFPDWSMGLVRLIDLPPQDRDGCVSLVASSLTGAAPGAGAIVLRLLNSFRMSMT